MEIIFTDHSLAKIEILKKHGIELSKEFIEEAVNKPRRLKKAIKTE